MVVMVITSTYIVQVMFVKDSRKKNKMNAYEKNSDCVALSIRLDTILLQTYEKRESTQTVQTSHKWRFGLMIASLGASTKLLYVEPG